MLGTSPGDQHGTCPAGPWSVAVSAQLLPSSASRRCSSCAISKVRPAATGRLDRDHHARRLRPVLPLRGAQEPGVLLELLDDAREEIDRLVVAEPGGRAAR